jgi:hypothetical protein
MLRRSLVFLLVAADGAAAQAARCFRLCGEQNMPNEEQDRTAAVASSAHVGVFSAPSCRMPQHWAGVGVGLLTAAAPTPRLGWVSDERKSPGASNADIPRLYAPPDEKPQPALSVVRRTDSEHGSTLARGGWWSEFGACGRTGRRQVPARILALDQVELALMVQPSAAARAGRRTADADRGQTRGR